MESKDISTMTTKSRTQSGIYEYYFSELTNNKETKSVEDCKTIKDHQEQIKIWSSKEVNDRFNEVSSDLPHRAITEHKAAINQLRANKDQITKRDGK